MKLVILLLTISFSVKAKTKFKSHGEILEASLKLVTWCQDSKVTKVKTDLLIAKTTRGDELKIYGESYVNESDVLVEDDRVLIKGQFFARINTHLSIPESFGEKCNSLSEEAFVQEINLVDIESVEYLVKKNKGKYETQRLSDHEIGTFSGTREIDYRNYLNFLGIEKRFKLSSSKSFEQRKCTSAKSIINGVVTLPLIIFIPFTDIH